MKMLQSNILKGVLLVVGYLSSVLYIRNISATFRLHSAIIVGHNFPTFFLSSELLLLLFFLCFFGVLVSVWCSPKGEKNHFYRNIDGMVLISSHFFAFLVCALIAYRPFDNIPSTNVALASIVAYGVVMVGIMEITARIRDKQFVKSLYVQEFFRKYSAWHPLGFTMALLFIGNLYMFWAYFTFVPSHFSGIVTVICLMALARFCKFILSLSAEYEIANVEKIRAERFKGELITNVSHDIRTPLTSIINYVDLMKNLPIENQDFTDYVEVLDRKTDRLKILIDDLMEASKASTGNLPVTLEEIDLTEMVGQIVGEFYELFEEKNLTLVIREPEEPVFAQIDRRHLWRALENVFSNSAKYSLRGTRVFAEIKKVGDKVIFSLKNTSAIPIDITGEELTEQFIRGDHARHTEGNGLGLYISKSLVELMGSKLVIHTSGDLFEVELILTGKNSPQN